MLRHSVVPAVARGVACSFRSCLAAEGVGASVSATPRAASVLTAASSRVQEPAPMRVVRRPHHWPTFCDQRRAFAQQASGTNEGETSTSSSSSADADAKAKTSAEQEAETKEQATQEAGDKEGESKEASETSAGSKAEAETEAPAELTEAEKLQKELDELQGKVQSKKKDLLLALADFENNKKKNAKEREDRQRRAMVNFATKMVEIYGEFETELLAKQDSEELSESCKGLYEGIVLTRDVYKAGLERYGVEELSPELGAAYMEKQHQDVGSIESELPAKSVAEVVASGWTLTGRAPVVLQKAKVKLAANEAA